MSKSNELFDNGDNETNERRTKTDQKQQQMETLGAENAIPMPQQSLPMTCHGTNILCVQSEFDLRTVRVAAQCDAPTVSPSLVHSDPNLCQKDVASAAAALFASPGTANNALTEEHGFDRTDGGGNAVGGEGNVAEEDESRGGEAADGGAAHRVEGSAPRSATSSRKSSVRGRLRNQSELEVNAQHYKMQNVYKSQRARKGKKLLTDIDFEGILRIIGGCSTWQILIYLIISAHQMPHAMFNLSVVYFTYLPDHWCKVPNFSREYIENADNEIGPGWSWEKALDSGIAFPQVRYSQRRSTKHDQEKRREKAER
ncbi:hypothetical protein niasHT_007282 [Heterodera trifolii]|uniref:Uncharacterized protein n=1 Tax=Heterodera trifolii TaxID=157864 RepID=A0ABD2LL67_9BILA